MQLLCGQCGQTVEAGDALAGGLVTCPHCQNKISVPDFGFAAAEAQMSAPGQPPAPPSGGEDDGGGFADMAKQSMARRVRVVCGKCGKGISVGVRFAGKRAKCPACGTMVMIPYPDEDKELELTALRNVDDEEFEQLDLIEREETSPMELPVELPAKAIHTSPVRRKRRIRKPKPKLVGLLVALAMLLVAIAVFALPRVRSRIFDPAHPPSPDGNSAPTETPENNADSGNSQAVVSPAVPAKLQVNSVRRDLFAAGGYYPAPPDQVYAKVTITVTAGGDKFGVESDSPDVVLRYGYKTYHSLGLESPKSVVPVQAVKQSYFIEPGMSQTMTLLFQVPVELDHARVCVGTLEAVVEFPPAAKEPTPSALAGTFAEKPPRNIQPLLRNPVMAALQAAVNQTVEIKRAGEIFEIKVSSSDVSGSVKSLGRGLYEGQLNTAGQTLPCKLRLAEEGKLLILYLTDEPFHQMTYERK